MRVQLAQFAEWCFLESILEKPSHCKALAQLVFNKITEGRPVNSNQRQLGELEIETDLIKIFKVLSYGKQARISAHRSRLNTVAQCPLVKQIFNLA